MKVNPVGPRSTLIFSLDPESRHRDTNTRFPPQDPNTSSQVLVIAIHPFEKLSLVGATSGMTVVGWVRPDQRSGKVRSGKLEAEVTLKPLSSPLKA